MGLSNDLISQFVKITNDSKKESTTKETTIYGTVTEVKGGKPSMVRFDGATDSTPVESAVNGSEEDIVIVTIKNHTATVTSNITNPSVIVKNVTVIQTTVEDAANAAQEATSKIAEFQTVIAEKAEAKDLLATNARVSTLESETAKIDTLEADNVNIKERLSTGEANITELQSDMAEIDNLNVKMAEVEELAASKMAATEADLKYADIDFSNIGEAAIKKLFSDTGIIENLKVSEGTITGKLVGVTISGDIIEGNTIVAEKLVVKGEDGLYYKLNTDGVTTEAEQTDYNSLNGSVIKAKSITATKISVDDLVAFDATIGGFNITKDSLYSHGKGAVNNSAEGVYMDRNGQFSLGDGDNYLRYFKDTTSGKWKLEVSAESISFTSGSNLKNLFDRIKVGTYHNPELDNDEPCIELSESDSDFKQIITNTKAVFVDGEVERTKIDRNGVSSTNLAAENDLSVGGFVWKKRSNGNLGLMWKGGLG